MAKRKTASGKAAHKKAAHGKAARKKSAGAAAGKSRARTAAKAGLRKKPPVPVFAVPRNRDWRSELIVGLRPSAFGRGIRFSNQLIDNALVKPLQGLPVVVWDSQEDIRAKGFAILRMIDPNLSVATVANRLGRNRDIRYVERNAPIVLHSTWAGGILSSDPYALFQWALARVGADQIAGVPPPAGGGNTLVAIVDSGLRRPDGTLPEDITSALPANLCQPTTLPYDNIDMYGHGTMLAGTIAAVTNNMRGIASPVPAQWNNGQTDVQLMPIKFFGAASAPTMDEAAAAIVFLAKNPTPDPNNENLRVRVINASWHVAPADPDDTCLRVAMRRANKAGILIVAAAGNDGTDNAVYPTFPANYGNGHHHSMQVLTVAAVGKDDFKAGFSNYSLPGYGSAGSSYVDIAAPGTHMVTTGNSYTGAPRYPWFNGTSAAAALCSAAAALVFALNPNWGPGDVQQYLKDSADKLPWLRNVCEDGNRLNIANALMPVEVTSPASGNCVQAADGNFYVTWRRKFASSLLDGATLRFAFEKSDDQGATWQSRDLMGTADIDDEQYLWQVLGRDRTGMGRIRATLSGPAHFTVTSKIFEVV